MMQIIKQTRQEKIEMYMKHATKKELAEMLATCNEILENIRPQAYIKGVPIESQAYIQSTTFAKPNRTRKESK